MVPNVAWLLAFLPKIRLVADRSMGELLNGIFHSLFDSRVKAWQRFNVFEPWLNTGLIGYLNRETGSCVEFQQ